MAAADGVLAQDGVPDRRRRRSQRQIQESEQNRQAIVRSALELFASNGYTKTTLHAVADRVGLTRQGLLHHFHSKEVLFRAVIDEGERWARQQSETSGGAVGIEGLRSLSHFVDNSQDVHIRLVHTLQAEALHEDAPEHVVAYARRRLAQIRLRIAEQLREAQGEGDVGSGVDVPVMATLMAATVTGLQTQSLQDTTVDVNRSLAMLIDLVTGRSLDHG